MLIREDIAFLRSCLKNKVIPKFIQVSCAVQNSRTNNVINFAKNKWIRFEIKFLFSKLSNIELEAYDLHLRITACVPSELYEQWLLFDSSVQRFAHIARFKKRERHSRKLSNLISERNEEMKVFEPKMIADFVVNLSNEQFTENELNLLNRGLKFTPKPNDVNITDSIVDIGTILKYKLPSVQDAIRTRAKEVIENLETKNKKQFNDQFEIIDSLKKRNCVYVKADKGNKLVVLDKIDYENQVHDLINVRGYKVLNKNPLPRMIRECDSLRQQIGAVFGQRLTRKLNVSNPSIALMYCLPKIHKEGKKMRPIVSSINTPSYKMAKWLVSEMRKLPPIKSRSVKNSADFVRKVKDIVIGTNQMIVSFDVSNLFPSINTLYALDEFDDFLIESDISDEKTMIYSEVARLCMKQNYFQFRDKLYHVEKGTNMGNPLSPLISECFMAVLERQLEQKGIMPDVWHRYVDDIFAVIERDKLDEILNILNSQFPTIKFTCETEIDNNIAFFGHTST